MGSLYILLFPLIQPPVVKASSFYIAYGLDSGSGGT